MRHSATSERPLTPRARLVLQGSAAATILTFYAAATFTMAILTILFLIGIVVVAGAARVGLSSYVADLIKPVVGPLAFCVNLWR